MDFRYIWQDSEVRKNILMFGISIIIVIVIAVLTGVNWGVESGDKVDKVGPKILRVTCKNEDGIYTINQNIDIVVEFNEEIDITLGSEHPRLAIMLNNEDVRYASYVDNKSNTEMVFRYSIKKGEEVEHLEYVSEDALEARGAVVRDRAGNVSSLLLPLVDSENSLGGTKEIKIITEDPYPIITESKKTSEMKEYTITFNRKVDGFDIDDIKVYNGNLSNLREIEENRIFKVDCGRSTVLEQTIVIPKGVCYDLENDVPNTYGVPIPRGFYYYGGDKQTGLVITDNAGDKNIGFYDFGEINSGCDNTQAGNAFVWVPLDYINDATGYYEVNGEKSGRVTESRFGRRDFKQYGFGDFDSYSESIPSTVVNGIMKYSGFFVGRYEGILGAEGRMGCKISKRNSVGYVGREKASDNKSTGVLYNYLGSSAASTAINKLYAATASVVPHMPYGAEWDTLMKWIEEDGYDVANDSSSWGNYVNSEIPNVKNADKQDILNSGITPYTEAKHMYDLAGNLWEWTQERTSDGSVVRGGVYGNKGQVAPAAYRTSFGDNVNMFLCTSRPFLYVK